MAKSKDSAPVKTQISLTLTGAYLDLLREVSQGIEGNPSVSALVDVAIRQYLEAKGKLPPAKRPVR